MKQDIFKVRYTIKLFSSILIAIFNIIIQMILPRALSINEYGYYSYNLNIFTSVVSMATLSVPSALVSKFSKRNEELGLVLFYIKFYLCVGIFLNIAVIFLYGTHFLNSIFSGQTIFVILLGLESSILLKIQTDSIGIFDAMAVSKFPALMQIVMKVVLSFFVILGYLAGRLNLYFFYMSQILVLTVMVLIMINVIIKEQICRYPILINHGYKHYFKEYFEFCRPLVLSNIISQMIVIFMNWVLMNWSGISGQAIFGVAWQLNSLVSYVFSPYAELSKREFAVICQDTETLRYRYIQSLKLMIWLTSYFAIFIGFLSEWILPIVYGDKYARANSVTLIIMFYTIYQAWGQISGSFLLALEKTKVSATLGVIGQIVTLMLVFLFQVPNFIWPMGLGSMGIALTYCVSNFISVTISLCMNAKLLQISFLDNYFMQIPPLLFCSSIAIILKVVFNQLWNDNSIGVYIGKVVVSGIVYTISVIIIIFYRPQLIGMTKDQLKIRK